MNDPQSITLWSKIEGIDGLAELALNLHWSWNHEADWLWERLDAELWQARQSPWLILQTISRDQLQAALAEPEFRQHLDSLLASSHESYTSPTWFQTAHPEARITTVAYFSMEFMLTEALPIYSGGLGNVAGDQLKAASDLGVPVVGVGLLYGQGYFRQDFDADGKQKVLYPVNDPGQMPVRPLRHPNGEWLRLQIKLPEGTIWLRCWEVSVGRAKLYLLDANDFANSAAQRCITSELYGGDAEMRLRQEIVLGIGGWRLLRAIGLNPEVCHLNEGHAAFAVFERARSYIEDHHCPFDLAMNVTRAGNVFTTHTAVAAGFDRFSPELIRKYLTYYAERDLGITIEQLLAFGRTVLPGDAGPFNTETFNMAFLAVRGSCHINGVSQLHGEVSREIFQPLFARWPREEVPIKYVTNGVHTPTWESDAAVELWTAACGRQRWDGADPSSDDVRKLTDEQLWAMRNANRKLLVQYLRKRYARQLASQGMDPAEAENIFDDGVMTAGFARRFATYKRSNLLLRDPERLARLLSDPVRPLQLVIAGKAHPQDLPGQALIQQWNTFIRRTDVRAHVIFLSDYDMLLAQELVQGIDLWINTPRRPWEACGTSGMKVLSNGGLNLSEIDGWWAEAYAPEVGWAIGDGGQHGNDPAWDAKEADDLYALLEREVIPEFYDRQADQRPAKWLARMRESMARLTPEFSASRTIRDYTETQYLPAAEMYLDRAAEDNALGKSLVEWKAKVVRSWPAVRFEAVEVRQLDGSCAFDVKVLPAGLDAASLRVEVYAPSGLGGGTEVRQMSFCDECSESTGALCYSLTITGARPASDYTVRVIPYHPKANTPLEADEILWQR